MITDKVYKSFTLYLFAGQHRTLSSFVAAMPFQQIVLTK